MEPNITTHDSGTDMRVTIEMDADTVAEMTRGGEVSVEQAIHRALTCYTVMENPDELLAELGELEVPVR